MGLAKQFDLVMVDWMAGTNKRRVRVLQGAAFLAMALATAGVFGEPVLTLPEWTVTATRAGEVGPFQPFSPVIVEAPVPGSAAGMAMDAVLRQEVPNFSLFRRTPSTAANPTAQGASLRGIGPSGASRTLVLLDGVPINDPFGGWVSWSQLSLMAVERVEVIRGGGSTVWGNTALGGIIHLLPPRPISDVLEVTGQFGDRSTRLGGLHAATRTRGMGLALQLNGYSSDGYIRVHPRQRGAVDVPLDLDYTRIAGTAEFDLMEAGRLTLRGSLFEEDRGNGTPLSRNATESGRLHAKWEWEDGSGSSWRADAWYWDTEYQSTFSSVSGDRSSEVLVLDQYAVPSEALGSSLVRSAHLGNSGRIVMGSDLRWIEGATNERVIFQGGDRRAGGEQLLWGSFAEATGQTESGSWLAGLRMDYWKNHAGFLQQPNQPRDAFPDREKGIFSARVGGTRQVADVLGLRGAVYQAFRVPTLNELYRPFRVGDDLTTANATLDPERLLGAEAGFDCELSGEVSVSGTVYYNTVRDPVLNVTVGQSAPGGRLRQRQNIGRTEIAGVELEARQHLGRGFSWRLAYAFIHARVGEAPGFPDLEGKALAQVPRHGVTGTLRYEPPGTPWFLAMAGRWSGDQYEDDLNTRVLPGFGILDFTTGYRFGPGKEAFLVMENVLDRRYTDSITGGGLVTVGPPRMVRGGLRWHF